MSSVYEVMDRFGEGRWFMVREDSGVGWSLAVCQRSSYIVSDHTTSQLNV